MICLEILWEVKSGDKSSKRWTAFGKFFSVSENIEDLGVPRLRIFETIQYSSPGEVGREILRVTWFSGREKGGGGQSSPTEYREGAKESKLPSNGQLEGIIRIL